MNKKIFHLKLIVSIILGGILFMTADKSNAENISVKLNFSKNIVEGSYDDIEVKITNTSQIPVIITEIAANSAFTPAIKFYRQDYGSISYDKEKDVFVYNTLAQMATNKDFYSVLLLPQQSTSIFFHIQIIENKAVFTVSYLKADWQFIESNLYFPTPEKTNMQDINFVKMKKEELAKKFSQKNTLNPAFLIKADIKAKIWQLKATVTFILAPRKDIPLKQAKQKIKKTSNDEIIFSNYFKGWAMCNKGKYYLVKAKEIINLPYTNLMLFKDVDVAPDENFKLKFKLPQPKETTKLSQIFKVEAGDGMYTQGDFINISKSDLLKLFSVAYKENLKITKTFYFFESYYYELGK